MCLQEKLFLDCTNLFSSNDYKKNDKKILRLKIMLHLDHAF